MKWNEIQFIYWSQLHIEQTFFQIYAIWLLLSDFYCDHNSKTSIFFKSLENGVAFDKMIKMITLRFFRHTYLSHIFHLS